MVKRVHRLGASFRNAMDGLVHVLRTQPHMRWHFLIIMAVLLLSIILTVSKVELLFLAVAIALVLLAELVNTAVETAVDLAMDTYHPLAKVAKDVAGAAVLVASAAAAFIGGLIFLDREKLGHLLSFGTRVRPHATHVAIVGLAIVAVLIVLGKLYGRRGTLLRGGIISGHAALGFFLFASVYYLSQDFLVRVLALLLALLVCQSRVDAGIHTLREVFFGALLALVVSILLFQIIGQPTRPPARPVPVRLEQRVPAVAAAPATGLTRFRRQSLWDGVAHPNGMAEPSAVAPREDHATR
jgi:diacylglycerol kinase (ATP)